MHKSIFYLVQVLQAGTVASHRVADWEEGASPHPWPQPPPLSLGLKGLEVQAAEFAGLKRELVNDGMVHGGDGVSSW